MEGGTENDLLSLEEEEGEEEGDKEEKDTSPTKESMLLREASLELSCDCVGDPPSFTRELSVEDLELAQKAKQYGTKV